MEELKQLTILSLQVKDKYCNVSSVKETFENEIKEIFPSANAGICTSKIYSNRLKKWVSLSKRGGELGENTDPVAKEILELTNKLYEKYLKD